MNEREYYVLICSYVPFGPARINLLVNYFGSSKKVWQLTKSELLEVGLKENLVNNFISYRSNLKPQDYFKRLKKLSINYYLKGDIEYPANLSVIEDAPLVLYVKGELRENDSYAIAIVGSRKMTFYGKEVTEKISGELSDIGITIISGLARGIDTTAHRSALNSGGRTIAVVATGLDTIYPPENQNLAREIVKKGCAIVSEYPLGYPAFPTNFPTRNRIISGLSRGIVVVEGARKSGTLLTATAASNQGRTVFAVPGQITSPLSEAPLFLIQNGAKIVTNVKDILDELDLEVKVDREAIEKVMPQDILERKIIAYLENESLHLDEIARMSGSTVSQISAKLTVMELKGMVKSMGPGVYKKN